MLTAEQRKAREFKITASCAPTVMSGDEAALLALWRELIGEDPPRDLSNEWAPMLGAHLEPYILDWHEKKHGHALTERGRVVQHPTMDWLCCTLDCYRAHDDTVIDVKVCNSWQHLDDIVTRYTPQAIIQRECRKTTYCSLLVMHGTAEPRELPVFVDAEYTKVLFERMAAFALCVHTMTPPVPLPKFTPPEQWRSINLDDPLDTLPNWAPDAIRHVVDWARTKDAADENDQASSDLKKLLPEDVGRVTCLGVTVRRDRRGYLSIKKASAA
jgi:hypothetical protein